MGDIVWCHCNNLGFWLRNNENPTLALYLQFKTQIPNSVNAQVPYKQVPASPVSTSSVSLSAGSTCHWLEIDTHSFKCVTKHDYKGKENNNALYFCKTFYLYQKLLHLLLSCFIPNLWGRLPACVFSHVGLFATPWTIAHQGAAWPFSCKLFTFSLLVLSLICSFSSEAFKAIYFWRLIS